MTPLEYYLWGAVKEKCYADNLETIDDLKDNIREAIGEIHLHIINNVLKNCVKDKCYADKPETIDALKDNMREAIGEIQLHTTDNVLKNGIDHLGYCMARRGRHMNEIIFHY